MNDLGLIILTSVVGGLALYLWVSLSLSAVFAKAGEERWKAWIPVWNTVVLLQLGGLSGWLVLFAVVPVLGEIALFVVVIIACHRINASFGFGAGMTVLAALLFPVWTSVVGWGSARWIGAETAGPVRRGDTAPPLDARVGGLPAAGYAPAPRPPAPGFVPPAPGFPPPAGWTPPQPFAGAAPTPSAGRAPQPPAGHTPQGVPPRPATPTPSPAPAPAPTGYVPVPGAHVLGSPSSGPASGAAAAVTRPTAAAPFDPMDDAFEATAPAGDRHAHDPAVAPIPASRSSARAAAAAARDEEPDDIAVMLGRSHAPFTQTVPTAFTPPADVVPPAAPRRAFAPQPGTAPGPVNPFAAAAVPADAPVAPPATGPVAPVQSVPAAPEPVGEDEPWAPPRTASGPVPSLPARATRYSPPPDPDAPFETSAEVSAVAGAPTLGVPRSARESVSAQHGEREIPDVDAGFDETVIASRRRPVWTLTPPLGAPISVTSDVVIIGRRPGFDGAHRDAQLVPVSDETRTMSKTHARLERHGDEWVIVDLDSTNGVILLGEDGAETEVAPGMPVTLTERFLLGDAELRLSKKDAVVPADADDE